MTFNFVLTSPGVDCKAGMHVTGVIVISAFRFACRRYRITFCNFQLVVNFFKDWRRISTNQYAIDCKSKIGLSTVIHPATDVGTGVDCSTWFIARLIAA